MRIIPGLILACVALPALAQPAARPTGALTLAEARDLDGDLIREAYDKMVDMPGTGPYPAIKEVAATLSDHVVYRPADLAALGGRKLGVMIWGNGGCRNNGASARTHLLEIASYGYLVIAPGGNYTGTGAVAPPPLAPGQPPPAPVIGIVDVPEIQRVSTAFTQVRDAIEQRRARLNEDLQREQQRWRDEQQRLANERGGLTPEQLRTRERELQDRITDSQRVLRERARDIEQLAQTALREIEQALGVVIRQVASSRNVNIVLPRPLVIFNEPPFDLTEEVAAQLNRMIPTVNLPAETDGAAPAQQPQQRPAQPPRQGGPQPQGQQRRN